MRKKLLAESDHNEVLNRRNCEIKSYNRQFRTRQENHFLPRSRHFGSVDPGNWIREKLLSPCFRRYFEIESLWSHTLKGLRNSQRGKIESLRETRRDSLMESSRILNSLRTKFYSRKFVEQLGASHSTFNTSCFLPDSKTVRSPFRFHLPPPSPTVFFRDKTSNNNPFLTAESFWRRLNCVFVAIRELVSQFTLQVAIYRLLFFRDVKNYWTLNNAVILAELRTSVQKLYFLYALLKPEAWNITLKSIENRNRE